MSMRNLKKARVAEAEQRREGGVKLDGRWGQATQGLRPQQRFKSWFQEV